METLIERFRDRGRHIPHFVIGGAMKSGTTTLHHLLSQHPRIYIPESEIPFFDVDEFRNHPQLHVAGPDSWTEQDFSKYFDDYFEWYRGFFEDAPEDACVGKTATSYLPSEYAPGRLSAFVPDVKLIFLLRDPVERAYSHYWHAVRSGMVTESFEEVLRAGSHNVLRRSLYAPQLKRYLEHFSRDSIKIILFEQFVSETQRYLDDVFAFLNVEQTVDVDRLNTHQHKARVPRSPGLQFWLNRWFRREILRRYHGTVPRLPDREKGLLRVVQRPLFSLNLARDRTYPEMNSETRMLLKRVLNRENRGLEDIVDCNVSAYWPWFAGG